MFERPKSGELAILVHIEFRHAIESAPDFQEFHELAIAAGAQIVSSLKSIRDKPSPKFYIGKGKVEEIAEIVRNQTVDIVLINQDLSPAQERNLEKYLKCRVLSRTGLILDIFASRARTFEGKLQVELAQLQHLSTRLVRGWTHLERQKGGIGLRGPGETQLETDRRLVRHRIQVIHERLEHVHRQREQNRRARVRQSIPSIAIVGYTNAGKSTLFNTLTGAEVLVANQLFATLDPTARASMLPGIGQVVWVDTVGFVQKLPHALVQAFHATLEETALSDILLHVVDAHSPNLTENLEAVNQVLEEIGAKDIPQIIVLNKTDLLENAESLFGKVEQTLGEKAIPKIWVSAVFQKGLNELRSLISHKLNQDLMIGEIELTPTQGALRSALYALKAVEREEILEEGLYKIWIRLPKAQWLKLNREKKD